MTEDSDDLERHQTPLHPRTSSSREQPSTRSLDPSSWRMQRKLIAAGKSLMRPGTHVQRYVLLERLGRGGMGEVYRAYDPDLDRRLALKLLRDEREDGPYVRLDRERMRREAQTLAQLSHPNVVTIYDVGQWDDRLFIAMELVDGIHLGRWLRDEPRSIEQLVPVLLAAGRGLAAAHAAGIVHRDFKPANVMVGKDGRVRVLDFGLATHPGDGDEVEAPRPRPDEPAPSGLTETGRAVGTPAYMAPEQHLGHELDHRSDQFSFCVSLFEAVARRRPFPGHDISALTKAKRMRHVVPLPEPSPIPPWLQEIIERGLAPRPEDRFPSMDALLTALERGFRRTLRRPRWLLAGMAGAGAALVALGWWAWPRPTPCTEGAAAVRERWGQTQSHAVSEAFAATRLGYAEESFSRVSERLDAYADAWSDGYLRVCEDLRSRGADDAAVDRRMRCLDATLEQLGATVEVLAEANVDTVRRAPRIAAALPTVERCDDPAVLTGPPPPGSAAASRVSALRRRLATAAVLGEAGRYRDGLVLARAVLDEAEEVDYPPLRIEAQYRVGALQLETAEREQAEASLSEAALAAREQAYDEVGVQAMIDLVLLLGEYRARPDEAETWAEHARASLARSPDPRAEARLLATEATVYMGRGDYETARSLAEQGLELRRRTLGDEHPELVGSHNNLANALRRLGRYGEAEHHYARALAIAEAGYGRDHPLVATLTLNIGGLLAEQGKLDQARPRLERAVELRRRSLGRRHPEVGTALNNLAAMLWESGERERAGTTWREALAIQEEALGPDDVKHVPLLRNLAEISLDLGQLDEAREHGRRALALLDRFYEPRHPQRVSTLSIFGRIAVAEGDLERGRARLQDAIAIVEEKLGPDHPHSIGARVALGNLELDADRPDVAAASFERALALMEAAGHVESRRAEIGFELAKARSLAGHPEDQTRPVAERARALTRDDELRAEIDAWLGEPTAPR